VAANVRTLLAAPALCAGACPGKLVPAVGRIERLIDQGAGARPARCRRRFRSAIRRAGALARRIERLAARGRFSDAGPLSRQASLLAARLATFPSDYCTRRR
jgi:hypothetical protein